MGQRRRVASRWATVIEGAIATGQLAGVALPKRALLWETATGELREVRG